MNRELVDAVRSAVERLPERQKAVFLLRFVEEMPLEAIAEATKMKLGTVKTHLFRAVAAVRASCNKDAKHDFGVKK